MEFGVKCKILPGGRKAAFLTPPDRRLKAWIFYAPGVNIQKK